MKILQFGWRMLRGIWHVLQVLWYLVQSIGRWFKWTFNIAPYPPGPRGPWAAINTVRAFLSPSYATTYYPYLVKKYGTVVMTPAPLWQTVTLIADAESHYKVVSEWRNFPRGWLQSLFASFIGMLIGGEGDPHKAVRTLVNPYLSQAAVDAYVPTIQAEIRKLFAKWKQHGHEGIPLVDDLVDLYSELSAKFLVGGHQMRPGLGRQIVSLITLFQSNPQGSKFLAEQKIVNAEIKQLLPLARTKNMGIISALIQEMDAGRMTEERVIAEIVGLISASVETTANLVAAHIYELSRSPENWDKLRNESLYVFNGRSDILAEDVPRLSQASLGTDETARMWPPTHRLQRAASKSGLRVSGTRNGERKEYVIPQWSQVVSMMYLIQTDPKIWGSDVLEFKPERMRKEALKALPPGAYGPFIFGPHQCPGKSLARYESTIFAAMLSIEFELPVFTEDHLPVLSATLGFPRDARVYF
jgi:cytochrome P450